jgi:hypothetical protein
MKKSNGCILWSGDSLIDGEPIVVLLTGLKTPSANIKTGWMLQTYIIHQNILPTDAIKSGADYSICGDCPMRGKGSDRSCYVNVIPVNNIWRKYKAGEYKSLDNEMLQIIKRRHLPLRITAYGDAAATPFEAWEPLLKVVDRWTGYTHQWMWCDRRWQQYLMASVESVPTRAAASSQGWRTFRVLLPGYTPSIGEILCPNTVNQSTQCESCGLCNGSSSKTNLDITDRVHGLSWKINSFYKLHAELGATESKIESITCDA